MKRDGPALHEFGNHPFIRLIWDAGWLFINGSQALLRLGVLQETVPISGYFQFFGLLADRFFCSVVSQPLAEDPLSKRSRMENGDDLDDLNVAHAPNFSLAAGGS